MPFREHVVREINASTAFPTSMPFRLPSLKGAATLVAALALGACASLGPRPLPPQVTLQAITAGVVLGGSAQARLRFAVRNPNAYDLAVRTFEYQMRIDEREVGAGALAQPVTLAADAVTAIDVDVRMDLRVMGAALDHQHLVATDAITAVGQCANLRRRKVHVVFDTVEHDKIVAEAVHLGEGQRRHAVSFRAARWACRACRACETAA